VLGRIAISLTAVTFVAGPLAVNLRAGSDSRRTAVVDAVEKVHKAVVSIASEKKAASHSRWPFSAEENQGPLVSGCFSLIR
jgi:serine protease Do